ncbi:MAG: hypothetical protein HQ475_00470 [SAR202 cluster bacterium]|nr:hypothetical protein [SAR202 cluster bacterium]
MPDRWECAFVDRIESDAKIVLSKGRQFGLMWPRTESLPDALIKVRKTLPLECGQLTGRANDNEILKAAAIATAFNRPAINQSSGLVVKVFRGLPAGSGRQTALLKTQGRSLRNRGTTEWLIYISPEGQYFNIRNKRFMGSELPQEDVQAISSCVREIVGART